MSYIGKTLREILEVTKDKFDGSVAVYLLDAAGESDWNGGTEVDYQTSLAKLLRRHPEVADLVVEKHNTFDGDDVFRVREVV